MDSMVTLVGSIVIGGIFLIGLLAFHGDVVDYSHEKMFELLTQETTASLMEIIDHDFRRLGSGWPLSSKAIEALVDITDITFRADIDRDGVYEIVRYYVSEPAAATSTPNPNDVILYRLVQEPGGSWVNTIDTPAGVTKFTVELLDEFGAPTNNEREARMLNISLTVQSLYPYDNKYTTALWEKRIAPQNLQRFSDTDL